MKKETMGDSIEFPLNSETYYEFEIFGANDSINGVLLAEFNDWCILNRIFSDYMFDGISFLSKKLIRSITEDSFTNKVLKIKLATPGLVASIVNLDNHKDLFDYNSDDLDIFDYFSETKMLCEFVEGENEYSHIGRITSCSISMFEIKPISADMKWGNDTIVFEKSKISLVTIYSDYLNTLEFVGPKIDT